MNNILSIKNLNKTYKDFQIKNINIDIPKGTIVGVIGENGAGKTTTIKSILNLINIESGHIKVFGKDNIKYEREIKEKMGVILDNSFFPETFTACDVGRVSKLMYSNWDEDLYDSYLNRFKLSSDMVIKELSTGMLIKLKIASILAHKPELLILDEPTSGLDPIARKEMLDIFQEFVEDENHSIFVSSHITTDLEQVADFIVFISNGEIILSERKDKLIEEYAIVKCTEEEFNKINCMDFIKYRKNKYNCQILINNKVDFMKKYNIKTVEKSSLEDIMLFYIKGE